MENREYFVSVFPKAELKLAGYLEFLAFVSESASSKLYQEYGQALTFLTHSPESCPLYVPNPKYRYKLFGKRYRIVFEIVGNIVYADDIQDCREDLDKSLV